MGVRALLSLVVGKLFYPVLEVSTYLARFVHAYVDGPNVVPGSDRHVAADAPASVIAAYASSRFTCR